MKFSIGNVVMTSGVRQRFTFDIEFNTFVMDSLFNRYLKGDWGNTCEEDAAQNNYAVHHDERIFAVYTNPKTNETIWIITEWDRSATTILFPSEY